MMKEIIKSFLQKRGYRIVQESLDAQSFRKVLLAQNFRAIIDVGAHTGRTVEGWLMEFPTAHVHAFEPSPSSFAALEALAAIYPGRVTAWNCAAGAADEVAILQFHEHHSSSSSLLKRTEYCAEVMRFTRTETPVSVDMRRLDTLLVDDKPPLEGPVLVKLDVQGFEDRVLAGAARVLAQTHFVLTEITIAPVYAGQCDFAKLHTVLTGYGFKFMGFLEQFHLADGTPIYADVVYRK